MPVETLPGSPGMKRPWMLTLSGKPFFPSAPEEYTYSIDEIAVVISRESRFNGHTKVLYTVGEHSCHVALRVLALAVQTYGREDPLIFRLAKAGLLHDGAEGYYKDLISPIKWQLPEYKTLIKACELAQFEQFGLLDLHDHAFVRKADAELLATEKRDLCGSSAYDDDWAKLPDPLTVRLDDNEYLGEQVSEWFLYLWELFENQELPGGWEAYQ